jgi:hypothetical protein
MVAGIPLTRIGPCTSFPNAAGVETRFKATPFITGAPPLERPVSSTMIT